MLKVSYHFTAKVWQHDLSGGWYFVTVPKDISVEVRKLFQQWEEGWGRLKCEAQINQTYWDTALWFDTKHEAYILPLKAEVRKKEQIQKDDDVSVLINI